MNKTTHKCNDKRPYETGGAAAINASRKEATDAATLATQIKVLSSSLYEIKAKSARILSYLQGPRPEDKCEDKEPYGLTDKLGSLISCSDIAQKDLLDVEHILGSFDTIGKN